MIASVVATLEDPEGDLQRVIAEISQIPYVETGDVGAYPHRLPITIDSPDPNSLEETTRRLQECRGVVFVDVVFVHFEDESECTSATRPGKSNLS